MFVLRVKSLVFTLSVGASGDIRHPADYDGDGRLTRLFSSVNHNVVYLGSSGEQSSQLALRAMLRQWRIMRDIKQTSQFIAVIRSVVYQEASRRDCFSIGASQQTCSRRLPRRRQGGCPSSDRQRRMVYLRSEDNSFYAFHLAQRRHPSPGDYDGDGRAVRSVSTIKTRVCARHFGTMIQGFGQTGDKSVPSAYVLKLLNIENRKAVSLNLRLLLCKYL